MKKVVTIGGAMHDIFLESNHTQAMHLDAPDQQQQSYIVLQEGKKIEVDAISHHLGGGALNSAVSFALLGHKVESIFKVGADTAGKFIQDQLCAKGVITNNAIQDSSEPTGTSVIIPCPSGDRAVLIHRGANRTLALEDIPLKQITVCDQLYITSLSGSASRVLPSLVKQAHQSNVSVAINPGTSQLTTTNIQTLIQALPYIDIFILNSYEATLLMSALTQTATEKQYPCYGHNKLPLPELLKKPVGMETICFTLQGFFAEILSKGPKIVVVTNGSEGVYACNSKSIYFHPSEKTNTISTLGAGDAFGSTFVSYITEGYTVSNALHAGVINAASVLCSLGSQTGLLTRAQLEEKYSAPDITIPQQFPFS